MLFKENKTPKSDSKLYTELHNDKYKISKNLKKNILIDIVVLNIYLILV